MVWYFNTDKAVTGSYTYSQVFCTGAIAITNFEMFTSVQVDLLALDK